MRPGEKRIRTRMRKGSHCSPLSNHLDKFTVWKKWIPMGELTNRQMDRRTSFTIVSKLTSWRRTHWVSSSSRNSPTSCIWADFARLAFDFSFCCEASSLRFVIVSPQQLFYSSLSAHPPLLYLLFKKNYQIFLENILKVFLCKISNLEMMCRSSF